MPCGDVVFKETLPARSISSFPRLDIAIQVFMEPETCAIRGNVMASGDAAADREAEEEVMNQIDAGNDWAWCQVEVKAIASYQGQIVAEHSEYLGCVSYSDGETFLKEKNGEYSNMKEQARHNLALLCIHLSEALQR